MPTYIYLSGIFGRYKITLYLFRPREEKMPMRACVSMQSRTVVSSLTLLRISTRVKSLILVESIIYGYTIYLSLWYVRGEQSFEEHHETSQ